MRRKLREKIQKIFGNAMFNETTKIPIHDVLMASFVMGDMNQEKFWDSLISSKRRRDKENDNDNIRHSN